MTNDQIALLDVDGVVGDFTTTLLRHINSPLTERDITDYNIFQFLGDQADLAKDICQDEDFWRNLDLIEGAVEGVEQIRSEGYEVYWLTAPWYTCKGWYQARGAWLKQHFGSPYNHMLPLSAKHLVQGDLFIDDRPNKVRAWANANPGAIALLHDRAHNHRADLPRFWWEQYRVVRSLKDLWSVR